MINYLRMVALILAVASAQRPASAQVQLGTYFGPDSPLHADAISTGMDGNGPNSPEQAALVNYYGQGGPGGPPAAPHMPPDPWGPERFQGPTPINEIGYQGKHQVAHNTRPDNKSIGIRLDTTYGLLREANYGSFFSEHQIVTGGGVTVLPYQSPCFLLGFRGMGYYVDNLTMIADRGGVSLDLYGAWRYKSTYSKLGAFWDEQDHFGKVGVSFSTLTKAPILGYMTLDTAFGFAQGTDVFGPTRDPLLGIRARRVENADLDAQIRVGHFFTPRFQAGWTWNYYTFRHVEDEWGSGIFGNYYFDRVTLGGDITGGLEGLRGYITVAWNFGASLDRRPRDCHLIDLDVVTWVSRATVRDVSVRLRESFTGPLPPGP